MTFEDQADEKVGYLANVKPSIYTDSDGNESAALLMYFISEEGQWTKAMFTYQPYFFLLVEEDSFR